MPTKPLTDAQLREAVSLVRHHGSVSGAARATGKSRGTLQSQIFLARQRGIDKEIPEQPTRSWTYPAAIDIDLRNATVLVGSDLHVWPGPIPLVWRAFCHVAKVIKPDAIIMNGDLIDGTRISRHPRLRNQGAPRLTEELSALQVWLAMLPKGRKFWTLGNHDTRVDNYLANMAPEADDFAGSLSDRFPGYETAYSVLINGNTEVRHNFRGGIHGGWNNTLHSGISTVTGHTHQLDVKSTADRNGRRYGIECGMLNDPDAPVFEYTMGMVRRWTAGFVVLTFDDDGNLLPPELCEMVRGRCWFRGADVFGDRPRIRVQALRGAA